MEQNYRLYSVTLKLESLDSDVTLMSHEKSKPVTEKQTEEIDNKIDIEVNKYLRARQTSSACKKVIVSIKGFNFFHFFYRTFCYSLVIEVNERVL